MDSQTVGRLGELAVEQELVLAGWRVGNYNASTANQKAFDIFAAKEKRRVEIRVKSYKGQPGRKGEGVQYSAKEGGNIFRELRNKDDGDFVVIVRISPEDPHEFYVIPTRIVDRALRKADKLYHLHLKNDGTPRKKTPHRWLDFDGIMTKRQPNKGFAKQWKKYRGAWKLLEGQ